MKFSFKSLITIFYLVIIGCEQTINKEVILIPDNFSGYAVIVYNQSEGMKEHVINDKVIYKFPKNGFLMVQGQGYVTNQLLNEYYYYGNNNLKPLCLFNKKKETACNNIIFNQYSGSFQSNANLEKLVYVMLVVGNKELKEKFDASRLPEMVRNYKRENHIASD